ncbi:FkbM family methyltransferase [Candidatus Uabimicrobium sp. HlEnr_7]|uniref:FkbM family methyltransferase n=1 Tax=Candidatus Uabimicrobium helgolandensis TaxID=3095367 RepID=UPI0035580D41
MDKRMIKYIIDRWYIKKPRFREFVTRLLYGSKSCYVRLFDTRVHLNTLRENGYFRVSKMEKNSSLLHHEVAVMLNLTHLVKSDSTFIDIGANIGVYSIFFAKFQHLYSQFSVHAFEVHPDTFSRLSVNAQEHNFEAYCFAISDTKKVDKFIEGAVSHVTTMASKLNAYSKKGAYFEAKCLPLSEFTFDGGNLILKIDVEGQEYEVLEGARSFFEDERVTCVYLDGYSDKRVLMFLQSYGFEFFDGRTLKKSDGNIFALLAIRSTD